MPSYLVLGHTSEEAIHILFAADVAGNNVRIVTAYHPNRQEWDADLRKRKST